MATDDHSSYSVAKCIVRQQVLVIWNTDKDPRFERESSYTKCKDVRITGGYEKKAHRVKSTGYENAIK